MASFKVPCPSCEHQVPIKDASAIGTKVECPKCKYRFKVEEPAGGIPKGGDKAEKPAKKKKAAAEDGGAKKKSKKLVAVVVGVLAVGILVVVGLSVIPGSGGNKTASKGGGGKGGGGGLIGGTGDGTGDDIVDSKGKDKVEPPPKIVIPGSGKEVSNLLPGQTVALYRVDVERLRKTPVNLLFDKTMLEMFRTSIGIDADQVGVYFHASVGESRDPFGIIRLITPVTEKEVVSKMAPWLAPKVINKQFNLYTFKSNPFANGVTSTLFFGSLFAEFFDKTPPANAKDAKGATTRVVGLCVYDSQHILVGDIKQLETFLTGLNAKGYPKFLSATENPPEGVSLAENPLYLSIKPKLKRVLKDLGTESPNPPTVIYAEEYTPGMYDPKLLKAEFLPVANVLDPVLTQVDYIGATLTAFTERQLVAGVRLVMKSGTIASQVGKDTLAPGLATASPVVGLLLRTPVEFRDLTGGYVPKTDGTPTGGDPLVPNGGPPGMGIPPVGMPPMGSGSGGVRPPPPTTGGPGPMGIPPVGMPPIGMPPIGMPPTGMPPTGTPPSDPNVATAASHIDYSVVDQNISITVELNWSSETYRRTIEPRLVGLANTLKGKMAVFTSNLSYYGLAAALPKMASSPQIHGGNRDPADKTMVNFPRGTAIRGLDDASRMGLRYPPHTRVSLFADMLPFLGRDTLGRGINRDMPWYEGKNLEAGEAWVPELLVPTYPQSAWRATAHIPPEGRAVVLGGTNYVAIAGNDLDAAYFDPSDRKQAKRVGISGYEWSSTVADVKDGLSNTLYLMQTPPTQTQPWIAGGGATLRGLNAADPMRGFTHTMTPGNKPGTYGLMADGSVRFIPANINPKVLLAMSTRAGEDNDLLADLDLVAPPAIPVKKPEPEVKPEPKPEVKPEVKAVDPKTPAGKVELAPAPRAK